MEFITGIFEISFICGIAFLIAAGVQHFFPPKRINLFYGYRTAASMKSEERWQFAQKYSTGQMVKASVFMILLSFTGFLFPESPFGRLFGSFVIAIVAVCYMFLTTERELKKRFKN